MVEGPFADEKRKAFTAEDLRFTTKGGKLYAIASVRPASGRAAIRHWKGDIASVELLGAGRGQVDHPR